MDAISFVLGTRTAQLRGNLKELVFSASEVLLGLCSASFVPQAAVETPRAAAQAPVWLMCCLAEASLKLLDAISFVLGARTAQLRGNLKELVFSASEVLLCLSG